MMGRYLFILAVLCAATAASAQERHIDQYEARALVREGVIQPLPQLLSQERLKKLGRTLDIELEQERGVYLYELTILDGHGVVHVYRIDARDGRLLEALSED